MPYPRARPDGRRLIMGVNHRQPRTRQDVAEQQDETPSQVATQTGSASGSASGRKPKSELMGLPSELLMRCVKMVNDPVDLLALSQVKNKTLHEFTIHWLLESDEKTRVAALKWACKNGDNLLLRTLFNVGAQVDQYWPDPYSFATSNKAYPLALAIVHQQVELVEALLKEHGANPQGPMLMTVFPMHMRGSISPMEHAFNTDVHMDKAARVRIINLLLDHGAVPDPPEKVYFLGVEGLPIPQAITNDDIPASLLARMLSTTSVHPISATGEFSLRGGGVSTFYTSFIEQFRSMSGAGFNPNQMEKWKVLLDAILAHGKALNWTAMKLFEDILFIDRGARKKKEQILQVIAANHSLTGLGPVSQQSPIVMAVNGLIVRKLDSLGTGKDGMKDRDEVLGIFKMLLDAGMDVKQIEAPAEMPPFHMDRWGLHSTAIACLCLPGYSQQFDVEKIIDFLIEKGVPVDAKDCHGYTALHYASRYLLADRVEQLLEHGADPNAATTQYVTALHFANITQFTVDKLGRHDFDEDQAEKRMNVTRLLLAAGADPTSADRDGFIPLHYACQKGFAYVVPLLLRAPDADEDAGWPCASAAADDLSTPLHLAAQKFQGSYDGPADAEFLGLSEPDDYPDVENEGTLTEIVEILVNCGADPKALDDEGEMPIVYARRAGFFGVEDVLREHGGI
ncbi:hypothetical protein SLS62_009318 [Diatrype stigma]|uniref:Uncharacterized protein n=1 Tax=Diatrype stigma TaxID=117547 RepID=A0AAN9YKX1_9PEZI